MTRASSPQAGSYLTPSFEHASVSDAMRPRVLSCRAEDPLVDVARAMASEHVHAIVVRRDGDGERPWAIVTDLDVLRCADRIEGMTAAEAPGSVMLTVKTDEPLADAAHRMAEHRASHAVVVSPRNGQPVGMLSTLDVAGILAWGRA